MNDTELIQNLRKKLEWTTSVLNHGVIPEPAHEGPCGPEAGCDYLCMETAHFYETLTEINKFLSRTPRIAMTDKFNKPPFTMTAERRKHLIEKHFGGCQSLASPSGSVILEKFDYANSMYETYLYKYHETPEAFLEAQISYWKGRRDALLDLLKNK